MTDTILKAIKTHRKHVVIQVSPASRTAIGEEFGFEPGTCLTGELNTALKKVGFDRVFDTGFSASLVIIEQAKELLRRLKNRNYDKDSAILPLFSSYCPSLVKLIQHEVPSLIGHLSTVKNPQQMLGTLIKTYYAYECGLDKDDIISVLLTSCMAEKSTCMQPSLEESETRNVDYVLSTRDAAEMIKKSISNLSALPSGEFDTPFGFASETGKALCVFGELTKEILRKVHELTTGENATSKDLEIYSPEGVEDIIQAKLHIKKANSDYRFLSGCTIKAIAVSGLRQIRKIFNQISTNMPNQYLFIEVLACPGGCVGGPISTSPKIRKARIKGILEEMKPKKPRNCLSVEDLHEGFLTGGPREDLCRMLLHTNYTRNS